MDEEEEKPSEGWRRYTNPDGSLGGWVHKSTIIEEGAYIGPSANIQPGSHVAANMRIENGDTLAMGQHIRNVKIDGQYKRIIVPAPSP